MFGYSGKLKLIIQDKQIGNSLLHRLSAGSGTSYWQPSMEALAI